MHIEVYGLLMRSGCLDISLGKWVVLEFAGAKRTAFDLASI